MSAWSKQAVPLIFFEVSFRAIFDSPEHKAALSDRTPVERARIKRLDARLDRWLQACWDALRASKHNPKDEKAEKKAVASARKISLALAGEWNQGVQTDSELTVALCIVAEDTLDAMPASYPPETKKAWERLIKALYDAWEISDPQEEDSLGYERGKVLAQHILEAAR